MRKYGVLLMNIGTPDAPTKKAIKTYLREFLLDPDVIDLPAPIRHLLVRGIILNTRPKKIAPRYQSIWMEEGSPLRVYTQKMCDSLELKLGDVVCEVGMRYGNPSIRSGLENLRREGVDTVLLAPLFPHHAQATTQSSLKHAYKQLEIIKWSPEIVELPPFPSESEFINPLVNSLKSQIKNDVHLLFSYHGLPISHIKRGDLSGEHCQKVNDCCNKSVEGNMMCYARHCMMTTISVVEKLGLKEDEWSISFQSRLGPTKWLEPSTIKKVEELAEDGKKNIFIISPSFLADGLETLEELNIEIRDHFLKIGGEKLVVGRCLNDDPLWIEGLSILISKALNLPGFVN